jgi:HK97 family phage prohead protease
MKMQRRSDNSLRSLDPASRSIQFVASTENTDRYGDRVFVKGWKLDNYLKNPIVLWGHDANSLPVGKAVAVEKSSNQLLITVQFATADANPQADSVYRLYAGGFLHAVSVGFLPLSYEMRTEDGKITGMDFHEQELLELSCVNVPANAEALARQHAAKNLGIKSWEEYPETKERLTDADFKAIWQALEVKPPNETLKDSAALNAFLKTLFAPAVEAGSVKDFISRGTR